MRIRRLVGSFVVTGERANFLNTIGDLIGERRVGGRTIGSVDFSVKRKRVINCVKPGNTKGSAAVGVLANVLMPDSKDMAMGNVVPCRGERRGTGGVKIMFNREARL